MEKEVARDGTTVGEAILYKLDEINIRLDRIAVALEALASRQR
jgi:hypothetical protein